MNPRTAPSNLNLEQRKLFYSMDRELFCLLTVFLHHDPLLAIRIMSFWFWMESSRKYVNLISHLHSLCFDIFKAIASETITCLNCLDDPSPFSVSISIIIGIPVFRHVVNIDYFDIPYIVDNRVAILDYMQRISDSVYANVFDDISSGLLRPQHQEPIVDERAVANATLRMSTQHERTVFLTFSKGYHVTETQLRDFFVRRFGEIIEELIMQDVAQEEQPLFARMLVHSSEQVEMVLGGQKRVRFTINGKHVYARKYVKKNPNAFMASSSNAHRQHSPPPSPDSVEASE